MKRPANRPDFLADGPDEALESLLDELVRSTTRASAAIDAALEFVDSSNRRIAELEREHAAGTSASSRPPLLH